MLSLSLYRTSESLFYFSFSNISWLGQALFNIGWENTHNERMNYSEKFKDLCENSLMVIELLDNDFNENYLVVSPLDKFILTFTKCSRAFELFSHFLYSVILPIFFYSKTFYIDFFSYISCGIFFLFDAVNYTWQINASERSKA